MHWNNCRGVQGWHVFCTVEADQLVDQEPVMFSGHLLGVQHVLQDGG